MAYFDSAKNRALWSKELSELRQEKERRAMEGYTQEEEKKRYKPDHPYRVRITLAQLEQEEAFARGEAYVKSMEEKRERWKKNRENEYQKTQEMAKDRQAGKGNMS